MKRVDYTGKKIGQIMVKGYLGDKIWECQCSCGKVLNIRASKLARGGELTCGHDTDMHKLKYDITGEQINEWKVIEYQGNQMWLCECSCGKRASIHSRHLRTGQSKSCGHGYNEFIDLTGKQIGEWKVLRYLGGQTWECECSCGKIKAIKSYSLRSGQTKSCGHGYNAFKDLTGQVIHDWTVGEYAGAGYWNCTCKCGTKRVVRGVLLRNGGSKSCGHKDPLDLAGQKFWEWEAIKYVGNHNWLCRCSCGTLRIIPSLRLRTGVTKSCGCKKTENYIKTIREKYGEGLTNVSQRHLTREQLQMVETPESLLEAIKKNFSANPTPKQLSDLIGITPAQTMRVVRKHGLEDHIDLAKMVSKYEDELAELFPCEHRSDRTLLEGSELDLYYPEHKFAIEFNGDYWHSEIFHDRFYHQFKSLSASESGIHLFHIFEHEWNNESTKEKIIHLIKSKLSPEGIKPIQARKCTVSEISVDESRKFLEKYHLQGDAASTIKIGISNEDGLLGVMTLGTPRFDKGYEYEIIRVAWKFGIAVTGGIERMFQYFIRTYNPESILTYANFSKFTGDSYIKLGFDCEGLTEPGYVWTNPKTGDTLSRYQTQKQKLLELNLGTEEETETGIMERLGYARIYDCGNFRFSWKKGEGPTDAG